ncbi:MAG: pantoate--beta-alanine ligase, partial [Mariprofundaceae bacterium]|nr:pantoate--beta-alanine ligase [Mariprofundaceae bacterium]
MNVLSDSSEVRHLLAPFRGKHTIALAPTMGCLHEGHASLIRKARELADVVVVSIDVNPLQFGPNEDMDAYPRTFEADRTVCEAEGVDIVFRPANLYASGLPNITLKVSELSDVLCGATRPGHFDGVVTVVNILFNIV